jgi:steroid delta-isomerase-like uncharacterized protein
VTEAERIVHRYIEAWNDREYQRLGDLVAESYVLADPAAPGGAVHGPAETEQYLRELVAAFPDLRIEIRDSLADDDVVMVELRWTGTHEGSFRGLPPTGRAVDLTGMEKHRVADGHLQRTDVHLDGEAFKQQLGLTFPAVVWQLPTLAVGKLRQLL